VKFGLIPELVGRIPIITKLDELSVDSLRDILTEPNDAILKQYAELFRMDNVKLTVTKEAVEEIARRAIKEKTGARGLRRIVEKTLEKAMFDIPSDRSIVECIVRPEHIGGKVYPDVKRRARRAAGQKRKTRKIQKKTVDTPAGEGSLRVNE